MGILIGGPTPQDGKSAYELAVQQGYIGTLTQWLNSLVGSQGIPGIPGPSGQGLPGAAGRGVQSAIVDGSGDLIVTYTDGSIENSGHVVGPAGQNTSGSGAGSTLGVTPFIWGFGDPAYPGITGGSGGYVKIGSMVICFGMISGGNSKIKLPFSTSYTFSFILYDFNGSNKQVNVIGGSNETMLITAIGTNKTFNFSYLT